MKIEKKRAQKNDGRGRTTAGDDKKGCSYYPTVLSETGRSKKFFLRNVIESLVALCI